MAKRPKRVAAKATPIKRQFIRWEGGIGLGNVIVLVAMLCSVVGFGFSFYYKANGTADEVNQLSSVIEELKNSVDDNDKNMRLLVDSSSGSVKQEINLLRTDVVKVATEQSGMQRQIEDMKDDIKDLDGP